MHSTSLCHAKSRSMKFSNRYWKNTARIFYVILMIFLSAAVILPSLFTYLLASKSFPSTTSKSEKYGNHCGGISSYLLWEINTTTTITMKLNTSECGFSQTPIYFVSVNGAGNHYCLKGYNAIYLPTYNSFQIYAEYECSPMTSTTLKNFTLMRQYNVNWIGFYL